LGTVCLSARESEVLALVLAGKDNRTIATELFLSEGTIKSHVHNIMKKTGNHQIFRRIHGDKNR
jgi:DNA-binding NarL/FixJ family response regulator